MVSNDTDNRKEVNVNNEVSLNVKEVVRICSKVKLENGTLTFDSFGSNETRFSTKLFLREHGMSYSEAETIINTLKENELLIGPIENYHKERKPLLWVFLKDYKNIRIYIKLMVYNKRRCVAVISLHD